MSVFDLRDAILKEHGVESNHFESVPVTEKHKGRTVWEGVVEVFKLWRHPKADYAYAWTYETSDGQVHHVTVLTIDPIQSARDAVRAAIVQEFRSGSTPPTEEA